MPDDSTHAMLGGRQKYLLSPGGLACPAATQLLHQPVQPFLQDCVGEVLQQCQLQPVETIKAAAQGHPPVPDTQQGKRSHAEITTDTFLVGLTRHLVKQRVLTTNG